MFLLSSNVLRHARIDKTSRIEASEEGTAAAAMGRAGTEEIWNFATDFRRLSAAVGSVWWLLLLAMSACQCFAVSNDAGFVRSTTTVPQRHTDRRPHTTRRTPQRGRHRAQQRLAEV